MKQAGNRKQAAEAVSSEGTYRMVPEKRTGSCVMMDSLDRSCSKLTCDTSIPSMSMDPPDFSVRRNSAVDNDDLPVSS